MHPYILVALPCYNEAENLEALMQGFDKLNLLYSKQFETRVIIINDHSTDNTDDIVEGLRCETKFQYIKHPENRGLTGGIITAFEEFYKNSQSESPALSYGLMDGDNSHNPMVIKNMVPLVLEGFDIVVASRYREGSRIMGVSWWRQILSFGLGMLFKVLRNIPGVRDYSCGYRMYSPHIVKKVHQTFGRECVLEKSFASMVEILVKCHNLGAICTEVPFLLRYDLKLGESKMPFKKTIMGNFKLLMAARRAST